MALDEFVCERLQVCVIELKLQLEGAIRQAAALAQQGNRLIHHGDKVHPMSSRSVVVPIRRSVASGVDATPWPLAHG